jgi:hypothetical protein
MKTSLKIGELPDWTGGHFSNKHLRGKFTEVNNNSFHSNHAARERRARIILNRIKLGQLSPTAIEAVERDYAKELKKLRKADKAA